MGALKSLAMVSESPETPGLVEFCKYSQLLPSGVGWGAENSQSPKSQLLQLAGKGWGRRPYALSHPLRSVESELLVGIISIGGVGSSSLWDGSEI